MAYPLRSVLVNLRWTSSEFGDELRVMSDDLQLSLTVPALLFPAISLLYLSYNGRFLALANLVRALHKEWLQDRDPAVYGQIRNLTQRLELIRWMQICGAASFMFAAASMTLIFYGFDQVGHLAFGGALVLLMMSVAFLLRENAISVKALQLQLASMKEH